MSEILLYILLAISMDGVTTVVDRYTNQVDCKKAQAQIPTEIAERRRRVTTVCVESNVAREKQELLPRRALK